MNRFLSDKNNLQPITDTDVSKEEENNGITLIETVTVQKQIHGLLGFIFQTCSKRNALSTQIT